LDGTIIEEDGSDKDDRWKWPVWLLRGLTDKIDTEDGSMFRFSRGIILKSELAVRGVDITDRNNIEAISLRMAEYSQFMGHVVPFQWPNLVIPRMTGKKLGILTNNCLYNVLYALGDLAARFEAIQTWVNTPKPKPAPDGILLICKKTGIEPADTLMIGNNDHDRFTAERAGAEWVIVKNGEDLGELAKIF
jgi:HAD superfamily hydrolase (TIGR01549 family)